MKNNYIKLALIVAGMVNMMSCTHLEPKSTEKDKKEIVALLNQWHRDAAAADFDSYFSAISEEGIFLGTDASENWDKQTFMNFAKPHFEEAPAWDFKAHDRNIYFSADGQTAWFDELLETWMETCRGSGVLIKTEGGWKIQHYNLAILVPNHKVQDYLKVLQNETPLSN